MDKQILLPYQHRWVNDERPLKIWLASRQIGKSFGLSLGAIKEAVVKKSDNMLLSSSERQSKELMRKVFMHLRALNELSDNAIEAERESKTELELKNGSRIIALPSSPDTVRGFSGNVFLDEFAFHQDTEEIWRAMYPTVTRGHKVRICSTANGKQNMFYRVWSSEDNGFSKHLTNIHDAIAQGLKADAEMLKRGIQDPDAWQQEYECKFVDDATAYLTYKMIQSCESEDATMDLAFGEYTDARSREFYLGMDIGRKHDLTVIWILEKVGDVLWTRGVRLLKKTAYSVQRQMLYDLIDTLHPRRVEIDATGIGSQMAEEANDKYGSIVEPVVFTSKSKEDLAVTLRRDFEDHLIRVPANKDIREDLHSVQKITTAAGNSRFDAVRTDALGHADRFWALALAAHEATTPTQAIEYESVAGRRGHTEPYDPRDAAWDKAHGIKHGEKRGLGNQRGF